MRLRCTRRKIKDVINGLINPETLPGKGEGMKRIAYVLLFALSARAISVSIGTVPSESTIPILTVTTDATSDA
jgi:hypothetical protein